jgi:hypothetical protein
VSKRGPRKPYRATEWRAGALEENSAARCSGHSLVAGQEVSYICTAPIVGSLASSPARPYGARVLSPPQRQMQLPRRDACQPEACLYTLGISWPGPSGGRALPLCSGPRIDKGLLEAGDVWGTGPSDSARRGPGNALLSRPTRSILRVPAVGRDSRASGCCS